MPKSGYILNIVGNQVTITSTIYLIYDRALFGPPPPSGSGMLLTSAMQTAYEQYLKNNIETFWSTFVGSTGNGNIGLLPPFNNVTPNLTITTNISIVRGFPPSTRSGAVFAPRWIGTRIRQEQVDLLQQGECIIRVTNGVKRSFITSTRRPSILNRSIFTNFGGGTNGTNMVYRGESCSGTFRIEQPGFSGSTYMPTERVNFAAHEYGHILGLDDRYVPLLQARPDYTRMKRLFDVPIYFPGVYQPNLVAAPPYNTPPYNHNQAPYNNPTWSTPQNNYSGNWLDPEYSCLFGWEHNMMSSATQPNNGPSPLTPSRCLTNATYQDIYNNPTGPYGTLLGRNLIIITAYQLTFVLQNAQNLASPLPNNGEYENITRFAFIHAYDEASNNFWTTNNFRNNLNGTFVGRILQNNQINNLGYIEVSDAGFTPSTTPNRGIDDVMDYRLSKIDTKPPEENKWRPSNLKNNYTVGTKLFHGHFNPYLNKNEAPHNQFTVQQISFERDRNALPKNTFFTISDVRNLGRWLEKGNNRNGRGALAYVNAVVGEDEPPAVYKDFIDDFSAFRGRVQRLSRNKILKGPYYFVGLHAGHTYWNSNANGTTDYSWDYDLNPQTNAPPDFPTDVVPKILPSGWVSHPATSSEVVQATNFGYPAPTNISAAPYRVTFNFFHLRILMVLVFVE